VNKFFHSDTLTFVARVTIGLVFVVASLEKIVSPQAFAVSVANYKLLPDVMIPFVATILPWMVLLVGLALLFGIMQRGASLLSGIMLVAFLAAVASALLRGLDISCGCFTQDPSVGKIGWTKLLENSGLLLLSIYVFFSASTWGTVRRWLLSQSATAIRQP